MLLDLIANSQELCVMQEQYYTNIPNFSMYNLVHKQLASTTIRDYSILGTMLGINYAFGILGVRFCKWEYDFRGIGITFCR